MQTKTATVIRYNADKDQWFSLTDGVQKVMDRGQALAAIGGGNVSAMNTVGAWSTFAVGGVR